MFNNYAVEIGDALWMALYSFLETTFPRDLKDGEADCYRCSKYSIDSIWEEGNQKFSILRDRESSKLYRLNFSYTEAGFESDAALVEVEKTYVPVSETPVFSTEEVEKFEAERYSVSDINEQTAQNNSEDNSEAGVQFVKQDDEDEEKKCSKCGKPADECTCEDDDEEDKEKNKKYSLEEIPEYVELLDKYNLLETDYNNLKSEIETLNTTISSLTEFKNQAERKTKQEMIDSFYMLSNEDKQDVINNIDTYSLDDIEGKLSIICVRNKVKFDLDTEDNQQKPATTFSLSNEEVDYTPAWIKSIQSVAKDMK